MWSTTFVQSNFQFEFISKLVFLWILFVLSEKSFVFIPNEYFSVFFALLPGSNRDKKHIESFFFLSFWGHILSQHEYEFINKKKTKIQSIKSFINVYVRILRIFFPLSASFPPEFVVDFLFCFSFKIISYLHSFFYIKIKVTKMLRKARITGYLRNWCLFWEKKNFFANLVFGHILWMITTTWHWMNHIFVRKKAATLRN